MDSITKKKALQTAQKLGEQASEKDIQELDSKLPAMKRGPVAKIWDKVLFLWEKLKSPDVPKKYRVVIAGALLYLALPIDVVPDAIPVVGLLDDVAVIVAIVGLVAKAVSVAKNIIPQIETKIEKKIEDKFYEISYKVINEKLAQVFSSILITTCMSFLATVIGCVILLVKPFGEPTSRYVAITIFTMTFFYALTRFIIYLKNYGTMTLKIAAGIYRKKNVPEGLADFLCTNYAFIAKTFAGIQIAQKFVPALNQIPDAPQIIDTFYKHYKKRIFVFAGVFILYSLLIAGTKFVLLKI